MKYLPVIFSLLFVSQFSFAQEFELTRCSTTEYMEQQMAENPEFAEKRKQLENFTKEYIRNNVNKRSEVEVIYIPTVVHVVYENETENISDEQVLSQIRVLNEDFRKMFGTNGWNTNPVGVDSKIEFVMAQLDPEGNPTNGITRTETTVGSFSTNDDVKYTENGGIDAWDTKSYLNFWVCDLGGGVLGYAQFPGGPEDEDGVVIGYKYYGVGHSGAGQYNLGRTATHEVGHWLDLIHIWGDGPCLSDEVEDTPPSKGSNYGCPDGEISACGIGTTEDMIENYMDYTDDICMNIVTKGQSDRMRAALDGPRAGIKDSEALDTIPQALDASLVGILSPTSASCGTDSITPSIEIQNLGVNDLNSLMISYSINPGDTTHFEWVGELAPNETEVVDLPKVLLTLGLNNFDVVISLPNQGEDGNLTNDKASVEAQIISEPVAEFTADKQKVVLEEGDSVVTFSNISSGSEFNWDFDNGDTSIEKNPAVKFSSEGVYNVLLTVSAPGCENSATDTMEILVVNNTVGIKPRNMNLVRVYPNPVSNTLIVKSTGNFPLTYSLFDLTGKILLDGNLKEQSNGLDLTQLASGVYFLKTSNGKTFDIQKIVKK